MILMKKNKKNNRKKREILHKEKTTMELDRNGKIVLIKNGKIIGYQG